MNFGKLLATGKSIINGRKGMAYRANRRVYLPKFESPKNPFAKTTPAPAAAAPSEARTVAVPVHAPAQPSAVVAQTLRQSNWAAKLNPISMFRGSVPARPVTAIQAELSLDAVKVVQNDLSNDEVEVVPIKSRPAHAAEAGPGEPGESWNNLGVKVFGANPV